MESESGDVSYDDQLNDRSSVPTDDDFQRNLKPLVISKKGSLTDKDTSVMILPNTSKARFCCTWIHWYSTSFGDHIPNSDEIHLATVEKEELWLEYRADVGVSEAVCYSQFVTIFNNHFPHVSSNYKYQIFSNFSNFETGENSRA